MSFEAGKLRFRAAWRSSQEQVTGGGGGHIGESSSVKSFATNRASLLIRLTTKAKLILRSTVTYGTAYDVSFHVSFSHTQLEQGM
jgi:hypothetical protein